MSVKFLDVKLTPPGGIKEEPEKKPAPPVNPVAKKKTPVKKKTVSKKAPTKAPAAKKVTRKTAAKKTSSKKK